MWYSSTHQILQLYTRRISQVTMHNTFNRLSNVLFSGLVSLALLSTVVVLYTRSTFQSARPIAYAVELDALRTLSRGTVPVRDASAKHATLVGGTMNIDVGM